MRNILLIVFILPCLAFAQSDSSFVRKMAMEDRKDDLSWFYKSVFIDWKLQLPSLIFFNSPWKDYSFTAVPAEYQQISSRNWDVSIGFAGVSIEPRLNLVNLKKQRSTIFVKFPVSIALSRSIYYFEFESPNNAELFTNERRERFMSSIVEFGGIIGYGKGFHSAYNNYSKKGIAFSIGYQGILSPFSNRIAWEDYCVYCEKNPLTGQLEGVYMNSFARPNKIFWTPVVQMDLYRRTQKNQLFGTSIMFWPFNPVFAKASLTFSLLKK